jgi:hypothetical protein
MVPQRSTSLLGPPPLQLTGEWSFGQAREAESLNEFGALRRIFVRQPLLKCRDPEGRIKRSEPASACACFIQPAEPGGLATMMRHRCFGSVERFQPIMNRY